MLRPNSIKARSISVIILYVYVYVCDIEQVLSWYRPFGDQWYYKVSTVHRLESEIGRINKGTCSCITKFITKKGKLPCWVGCQNWLVRVNSTTKTLNAYSYFEITLRSAASYLSRRRASPWSVLALNVHVASMPSQTVSFFSRAKSWHFHVDVLFFILLLFVLC